MALIMGRKKEPLVLYSTQTWLAYVIAEKYYNHTHYAWCSPHFSQELKVGYDSIAPPTSTPLDIYARLLEDVNRRDKHSSKVEKNKVGILRGANLKRKSGIITESHWRDIVTVVDIAETSDFKPLIYVIPFHKVRALVKSVPVMDRAHPLSEEYIIEALPSDCFDIISFNWR